MPLIALWSNLHGAVLAGLAVAGAYLVVDRVRRRPLESLLVLLASIAALAATPALDRTPAYYRGVLENEAAKQGFGLWEPLSLTSPTDLLLVAGAVVLLVAAVRTRPRAWELVAMAGLAVLTLRTARSGVWLLDLAATPAACGLPIRGTLRPRVSVAVAVARRGAILVAGSHGVRSRRARARTSSTTGSGARPPRRSSPTRSSRSRSPRPAAASGCPTRWTPSTRPTSGCTSTGSQGEPAGDAALSHAPRVVLVRRDGSADDRLREPRFSPRRSDDHSVLYVRR